MNILSTLLAITALIGVAAATAGLTLVTLLGLNRLEVAVVHAEPNPSSRLR